VYSEGTQATLNGAVMVCAREQGRMRWKPLYGPDERFLTNDEDR
jgi:hypothetical protein